MTAPILQAAEAILAAAEDGSATTFSRSPLEVRVLLPLQQYAPLALTPKQVADILGMHAPDVAVLLRALTMLGTIEHPSYGCYRDQAPHRRD